MQSTIIYKIDQLSSPLILSTESSCSSAKSCSLFTSKLPFLSRCSCSGHCRRCRSTTKILTITRARSSTISLDKDETVQVSNGAANVRTNVRPVVIGVAADSGCGKTTFMKRLASAFGESDRVKPSKAECPPVPTCPGSNTLINEMATVICLDDYHSLDRKERAELGVTALEPRANNFDLMYQHVMALKNGQSVLKPIYNHSTGQLDPPELIQPPRILLLEGLHPMYDSRVRDLLDFSIYLDISDEVKFSWKIQRDMAERGHSLESIKKSIAIRKPYFDKYIAPQRQHADVVIQVLPTQLIPNDHEHKILRVRMIMKEESKNLTPVYLFDEGSTITWIPCGRRLTCSYPGIRLVYGPDTYYGNEVSVIEMDGQFDRLNELIYVESNLSNTSTKFYGEITHQMLKNADFPGSNNGTGFFQTIVGLKIREVYERLHSEEANDVATVNDLAS